MYKLNEEKMFFDVADGQAIVINFVTGMYYGTTALGSVILERILKGNDVSKIAGAVKKLDGCPADIESKINEFVEKLKEKEIIVDGETTDGGDEEISKEVSAEGFELNLDEFAEVQDLILADPVHDVDVEEGWPILKENDEDENK